MWVFGYGSLMWDGWEKNFTGSRVERAVLVGYRRSFNKASVKNWGTKENPAPTLGLEPGEGENCVGTAFEFADDRGLEVEKYLIEREGSSFSVTALSIRLPDGRDVSALTPVNNRSGPAYLGDLPVEQRARIAQSAAGAHGNCVDYVSNIHEKLESLRIVDLHVIEFRKLLDLKTAKTGKPTGESSARPYALLPRWANEHDGWCRAVANDILRSRTAPSERDVDRYLGLLLSEKKLSDTPFPGVPRIEEKDLDQNPMESVRITSLQIGGGVNALRPGTQIDFSPGVTVIFGENGAGKSGFVRVLKRAAGSRAAEEILPNVLSKDQPSASASFGVVVGSTESKVEWKNEFGGAPLNRISIFDSRGARLHMEDDLTYVYTPDELTLFPLMQQTIERVRTALEVSIAARTPGANTLLGSFDRSASIYSTIETLGAATDLDEVAGYARGASASDDVAIDSLMTEIDALKSKNTQNALKRSRSRANLVAELKSALSAVRGVNLTTYISHLENHDRAMIHHQEASIQSMGGLTIPGLLADDWASFIQAAEDYLKKHESQNYPTSGSDCIYCHQALSDPAIGLIQKYRNYCNNTAKAGFEAASKTLDEYVAPVVSLDLEELSEKLAAEVADGSDTLSEMPAFVSSIERVASGLSLRSSVSWPEREAALSRVDRILREEATKLAELEGKLQSSVEERQAALRQRQSELVEVQARRAASTLMPQIEKHVQNAKWVARATIVKSNLTSVLRSMTAAAKEASEELLNKEFAKRFEEEVRLLRAPKVTLNFPGRQGQVTRRKMVATHRPSQILSEGEQKVLALADFMAEVTSMPASSPVVFDDPITSMDYRRIHEVSDRVVALAQERQVIVFTHNVWFASELLAKAEKTKWKYYDIRIEDGGAGVVTAASHPRLDSINQVVARVAKLVKAAAEQKDGGVQAALVEKGYEELRNLCEIIIEQEVLKGVVQRYFPNVMMTKLEKINVAGLQASIEAIFRIFEKCCRYIASHSQPLETQGIRPTLNELKADSEALLKAREAHKS